MSGIDLYRALDEVPCDFALHLAQRLGLDREAAAQVLGEWLARYEPESYRPVCLVRVDGPKSGSSPDAAERESVA